MKKSILLTVLLVNLTLQSNAQVPYWSVDSIRKLQFPEKEYLVGFASEKNTSKEEPQILLSRIEGYAKGQLIEYIRVTVQSEVVSEVKEVNDNIQKKFRSMYSTSSNLELIGLKVEKSYDPKTKRGYVLVSARKTELFGYYKSIVESGLTKSALKIEEANAALKNNDVQHSLKACLEASNLLPEVEQAQRVLLAIKAGNTTDADVQNERTGKQSTAIEDIIRLAQRSSGNTIDEASFFIARGLKLQTGSLSNSILLSNFTYQDTKMGSELSRRLNQSLASKLVSEGGYNIQTEAKSDVKSYILMGTFWKETNEVKLIATLKDLSGKIVATAEAFIPNSWFGTNKVNYMPENFAEAHSKMRVFGMNEIVKGDLNLEVLTNKGDDNLLYTEGEKLKFFVRTNKECYLRFIYHTADGQKVLLLDNYYIAENMVNKMIELPYEFECAEPFGIETLQANAQTTEFPQLSVTKADGFDFINETLDQVLINTRSFKKASGKEPIRTEQRLVFTTLKK